MKFSASFAFADYGHVILPGLAGVIGLAAITSQWIENHRLRADLEKFTADRAAAAQAWLQNVKVMYVQSKTYSEEMNKWIDGMNDYTAKGLAQAGDINQSAEEAVNARNAQAIASIYGCGAAAGVQWQGATKEDLIKEVVKGGYGSGAFSKTLFQMPFKEGYDLAALAKYLRYEPGAGLTFDEGAMQKNFSKVTAKARPSLPPMPKMPVLPDLPATMDHMSGKS